MNAHASPSDILLDHARRMVPRYTSYPTAPHFTPEVTGEIHGRWLEEARAGSAPVSLYLHVPFCRSICTYCGCTTKAARRDEPVRAYAADLRREIALVAERVGGAEVSHIHWGGGTPNILPADCFDGIMGDLRRAFRFRTGMEHAIELDPRHLTPEAARRLADMGISRASLGVQTLDPAVQAAIGRAQPAEVIEAAFEALRAAGITAVNADLMYGLPRQTCAAIEETARFVLSLRPSRLSIFGYAHVPWMKSHQKLIQDAELPGPAERLRQAALARQMLLEGGYAEVGIDHFALPDDDLARAARERRLHRNFQGYTTDDAQTLIGLGASSISRTPAGFAQNAPDVHGWRRAIEAGALPVVKGRAYEGDDRLRADLITDILCYFEADLAEVASRHGASVEPLAEGLAQLRPLMEAGWVDVEGTRVAIRAHRAELARVVASAFDTYLGQSGRHSAAV